MVMWFMKRGEVGFDMETVHIDRCGGHIMRPCREKFGWVWEERRGSLRKGDDVSFAMICMANLEADRKGNSLGNVYLGMAAM